jgi:hypothetical protein
MCSFPKSFQAALLLFFVSLKTGECQKIINSCDLIYSVVSSEQALDEFFVCKNTSDTIIVFDSVEYLSTLCSPLKICGKIILFSHQTPINKLDPKYLELYRVDLSKKVYTLYIWRPYSGAAVIMTFKAKKRKIKLINWVTGSF